MFSLIEPAIITVMKRGYLRFLLLMWFTASMSIANTHIHHDLNEHEQCVKCFAHDHIGCADVPSVEPIAFEAIEQSVAETSCKTHFDAILYIHFDPRAPPFFS